MTWYTNRYITLLHFSSQQRNKFLFFFCSTIVNIVFSFIYISTLQFPRLYVRTFDFIPRKINDVFGADHMTRINHIYSRLPRTLFSHILTSKGSTLSLTFWLCQLVIHSSIHVTYIRYDLFLSYSAFSTELVPIMRTASDISSNHERQTVNMGERTSF